MRKMRDEEMQVRKKGNSAETDDLKIIVMCERTRVKCGPGFDSQPRHRFFLCLILTATRVFCDFSSFSIIIII